MVKGWGLRWHVVCVTWFVWQDSRWQICQLAQKYKYWRQHSSFSVVWAVPGQPFYSWRMLTYAFALSLTLLFARSLALLHVCVSSVHRVHMMTVLVRWYTIFSLTLHVLCVLILQPLQRTNLPSKFSSAPNLWFAGFTSTKVYILTHHSLHSTKVLRHAFPQNLPLFIRGCAFICVSPCAWSDVYI